MYAKNSVMPACAEGRQVGIIYVLPQKRFYLTTFSESEVMDVVRISEYIMMLTVISAEYFFPSRIVINITILRNF
jgi:hypothetical protein